MPETTADKKQKRLKILEADEIETVYGLPVFDDEDRAFYFALSPPERAILSQLHGPKSYIYYILQLGYFKARRQFFVFNLQQVAADAQYVQRIYFPDYALVALDITKVTRLKPQGFILELLQYRVCGEEERRPCPRHLRVSTLPRFTAWSIPAKKTWLKTYWPSIKPKTTPVLSSAWNGLAGAFYSLVMPRPRAGESWKRREC